jgi:hypothetical protein
MAHAVVVAQVEFVDKRHAGHAALELGDLFLQFGDARVGRLAVVVAGFARLESGQFGLGLVEAPLVGVAQRDAPPGRCASNARC